jgi:hypothetical protein
MALPLSPHLKLGAIELSDHFRAPVSVSREGRLVEVELASGKIKKYFKGNPRSTFDISWQWLPAEDNKTVDGHAGRDTLRFNFKDSKNTHILTFRDEGASSESYTVWVESYTEEVVRRGTIYFWNVTLTLREQ